MLVNLCRKAMVFACTIVLTINLFNGFDVGVNTAYVESYHDQTEEDSRHEEQHGVQLGSHPVGEHCLNINKRHFHLKKQKTYKILSYLVSLLHKKFYQNTN